MEHQGFSLQIIYFKQSDKDCCTSGTISDSYDIVHDHLTFVNA